MNDPVPPGKPRRSMAGPERRLPIVLLPSLVADRSRGLSSRPCRDRGGERDCWLKLNAEALSSTLPFLTHWTLGSLAGGTRRCHDGRTVAMPWNRTDRELATGLRLPVDPEFELDLVCDRGGTRMPTQAACRGGDDAMGRSRAGSVFCRNLFTPENHDEDKCIPDTDPA